MYVQEHNEKLFQYYNDPMIVAGFGQQEYIWPCERLFWDIYIKPGMAVLDIGVGGGRTSPYLAKNASRYVGVDYSPEMVRICRTKYPQWEYLKCSASDLSPFQNGSFDVVVMTYNLLDELFPHEDRWRCLQECHRVLREDGLFIFSSQNPRGILVRPRKTGKSATSETSNYVVALFRKVMDLSTQVVMAVRRSAHLAFSYLVQSPFWRGEGYMLLDNGPDEGLKIALRRLARSEPSNGAKLNDGSDDKLMVHFWTPRKAIAELGRYGFRLVASQGADYPLRSHFLVTRSYYYVFRKSSHQL